MNCFNQFNKPTKALVSDYMLSSPEMCSHRLILNYGRLFRDGNLNWMHAQNANTSLARYIDLERKVGRNRRAKTRSRSEGRWSDLNLNHASAFQPSDIRLPAHPLSSIGAHHLLLLYMHIFYNFVPY